MADPIVEGGGSDQFQRKLVYVALGEALTAPDDDPVDEEIHLVEKLQVQEGPHEGRRAARRDLAAADSLSSGIESASSPSSNVELFSHLGQGAWPMYFVTVFTKARTGIVLDRMVGGRASANPFY